MTNTLDHTEREAAGMALRSGATEIAVARALLAICDTLTDLTTLVTELAERSEPAAEEEPAPVAPPEPTPKPAAPKRSGK